jgi:hypothetical protein
MTLLDVQYLHAAGLLDGSLLRQPLVTRLEKPDLAHLEQFLLDVLAWGAGQRGLLEATRDYLRARHFKRAALCMKSDPELPLEQELEQAWSTWWSECEARLGQLRANARQIEQAGAARDQIAKVHPLLDEIQQSLQSLPRTTGPQLRESLVKLDETRLEDLQVSLDLAQEAIQDTARALALRAEQEKQRLLHFKSRADQLINDLLLRTDLSEQHVNVIENLQLSLGRALRGKDTAQAETLLEQLARLARGEPLSMEVAEPLPLIVPPPRMAPLTSVPTHGHFSLERLSAFARRVLQEPLRSGDKPRDGDQVPTLDTLVTAWEWDLKRLNAVRLYALSRLQAAEQPEEELLGYFLVAQGKLWLLEREVERARVFFVDGFKWASAAPSRASAANVCATGLLLSLVMPYLPEQERADTLRAENLAALFQRNAIALARLHQLSLWPELALVLVGMGMPAAGYFFDTYLKGFLDEHPPAAQDFVAGLLGELPQSPRPGQELLRHVLPALGLTTEDMPPLPEEVRQDGVAARLVMRKTLRDLATWFDQLGDEHDLALVAARELHTLADRLERSHEQERRPLNHRLLTPKLTITPRARLVLELYYPEEAPYPLRNLRTSVRLQDAQEKEVPEALQAPAAIPRLLPGQRRELTIPLARHDEQLQQATRLQVIHTLVDDEGIRRPVDVRTTGFSVTFEDRKGQLKWPPNPYDIGLGTRSREDIYGREEPLEKIRRALVGASQDNAVLVVGERRIGKTTLLHALEQDPELRKRYLVLRVDLQTAKYESSSERFFLNYFISPIHRGLVENELDPPVVPDLGGGNAYSAFRDFMERVDLRMAARKRRLLLVMDELDELLVNVKAQPHKDDPSRLGMAVVSTLRTVIGQSQNISFIFAGVTGVVREFTRSPEDRLFRLFLEVELPPLAPEACRQVIDKPAAQAYQVTPAAAERIIGETSGQPYLLKYVCNVLYDQMFERRARIATVSDVEELLQEKMIPKRDIFDYLKLPNEKDFALVKRLAALQSGAHFVSTKDLHRSLQRSGSPASREEVYDQLKRLAEQSPMVVERSRDAVGYRFRIPIGLYASHLRFIQEEQLQQTLALRQS